MNMFSVISLIFFLLMGISFISAAVFIAIWTYRDAKERGLPAGLWTFIVVLFSKDLLGILLYVLIGRRDSRFSCPNCGEKTPIRGKHCSECGTPIDAAKIPVFRNARKWLIAFGIALAVGFASVFGFFITAVANPPEGLNNVSIGSFSNGVGNEWTYTAMYSTQTQTREFVVNSEEDDMLNISGVASSGTMNVIITVSDETSTYATVYPIIPGNDMSTNVFEITPDGISDFELLGSPRIYEIPIDQPVGSKVKVMLITDDCKDVEFSASLS